MSIPKLNGFPDFNDDDNDDDDNDDYFNVKMESELTNNVSGFDFISTMEDELNTKLIGGIDVLGSALPLSLLDNGFYPGSLDNVEDATNPRDDRHRRRRVHGKCKEGYAFGNIFD